MPKTAAAGVVAGALCICVTCAQAATAVRASFGKMPDGTAIEAVELANGHGVKARIITYGATLQSLDAPDRNGKVDTITLGYDTLAGYLDTPQYFGATVGRYANRIAAGRFVLDGRTHQLALNNGKNALHGGKAGFDKRIWSIAQVESGAQIATASFTRVSEDGEEGYPGKLTVRVSYALSETDALTISYRATTDKPTVVNLTNHALFNLAGTASARSAMDASLQIEADGYTPVDATLIPTGEIKPVAGSPFDFRKPMPLSARLRDARDPQILLGRGIDHNFVLRGGVTAKPKLAATLVDAASGRGMRILTTEPGVQVYTGNFLDGTVPGHGGQLMRQGDGIALEAQRFPDTPNKPAFPSARLEPGATYEQVTMHQLFIAP
jgi:aldose 1-epimerase